MTTIADLGRTIEPEGVDEAGRPDYVFDGRWVTGGIGRFAAELRQRLQPRIVITPNGVRASSPWSSARIGHQMRAQQWPLLFTPGYMPPLGAETRSIATVHDLMYARGGAAATGLRSSYFEHVVRRQLGRCALVVTGSMFVRDLIADWLGPQAPQIDIVGYGLTETLVPSDALIEARRDGRTWLFLGGDKVNKNLPVALQAWQRSGLVDQGHRLVVVGFVADQLRRQLAGVTYTGPVPDAGLREIYAMTSFLLMPSVDEGYGLPALEGIAARIPVVFATVGPLPEVIGDCGIPVSATNVASVVDAMHDMVGMSWEECLLAGSFRARQQSWDTVAGRVGHSIRSVAQ